MSLVRDYRITRHADRVSKKISPGSFHRFVHLLPCARGETVEPLVQTDAFRRTASPAAEGKRPEETASTTHRAVQCMRGLGIVCYATLARAAQARAVNEIVPSDSMGRRSRMRSRRRTRAVSSSDMV